MPIVQAGMVRADSVLSDNLRISTLAAGIQTSTQSAHVGPEGCLSIQGFYVHRSMRLQQNVSFWHNSTRHTRGRGLLMAGFLRDMQW